MRARGDLLFAACVGFALGIIAARRERIEQDDGDQLSNPDPYLTGLTNSGCTPSVAGQGDVPAVSHHSFTHAIFDTVWGGPPDRRPNLYIIGRPRDPAFVFARESDSNVISIVRKHDGDK